jgi:hypothetical protein
MPQYSVIEEESKQDNDSQSISNVDKLRSKCSSQIVENS